MSDITITTLSQLRTAGSSGVKADTYILGANITVSSSAVSISKYLNLNLNGYNITASSSLDDSVLTVTSTGTLHIVQGSGSGTISGAKGVGNRAIRCSKTVIMDDGVLSGNQRAVYITSYSTFTMNGGSISGNTASGNNSPCIDISGGTFTMNGGSISNNSKFSSLIEMSRGWFYMNGGTITGNTTTSDRGGGFLMKIYDTANVYLYGGEISGNRATSSSYTNGAIHVLSDSGKIYVKGNPVVKNNTLNGATKNITIYNNLDSIISQNGDITGGEIHISNAKGSGNIFATRSSESYIGAENIVNDSYPTLCGVYDGTNIKWGVPSTGVKVPVYTGGAWHDSTPQNYTGGAWHDVSEVDVYTGGAWHKAG